MFRLQLHFCVLQAGSPKGDEKRAGAIKRESIGYHVNLTW